VIDWLESKKIIACVEKQEGHEKSVKDDRVDGYCRLPSRESCSRLSGIGVR
jgi:hypothetical protein